MGTVGQFVRERIEVVSKQQKVVAAEVAEAIARDGGRKVEASTVETKLSKLLGESSWGEGHRFFLEDAIRRQALASVLSVSPALLDERIEAARGEVVLVLDPALPSEARASFAEAAARHPGKLRVKEVGSPAGSPPDAPRALREAAAGCDSALLVLSEATAGVHAGFFDGADLRHVAAQRLPRGWRLGAPWSELVPLPPPPGPRLVDEDGHPMVEDAEYLKHVLDRADKTGYEYRPSWLKDALASIRQDQAEERPPTFRVALVVDRRLRQAVETGGASYAAEWSGEMEAGRPGEWFQVPSSLGEFERQRLEAYQPRRREESKERARGANGRGVPPEAALLEKARDPEAAIYWRHQGILYRLGRASTDLGLPGPVAPRSAEAGVAFLAELPAHNFSRQEEPGFIRFREEAVKAAAPFGIRGEAYLDAWSNARIPQSGPPFRLEAAAQSDLVREARQELQEFCGRDAVLDEVGLDRLDILARAARAPLRVVVLGPGLRMVRAELGGGRVAVLRLRRFAKTPRLHLVDSSRSKDLAVLDGGDLEIDLQTHGIWALEGPFLAARASRARAEADDD